MDQNLSIEFPLALFKNVAVDIIVNYIVFMSLSIINGLVSRKGAWSIPIVVLITIELYTSLAENNYVIALFYIGLLVNILGINAIARKRVNWLITVSIVVSSALMVSSIVVVFQPYRIPCRGVNSITLLAIGLSSVISVLTLAKKREEKRVEIDELLRIGLLEIAGISLVSKEEGVESRIKKIFEEERSE